MQVFIALRRPSDQEMSEPKPFMYLPQEFGEPTALGWQETLDHTHKSSLVIMNSFVACVST